VKHPAKLLNTRSVQIPASINDFFLILKLHQPIGQLAFENASRILKNCPLELHTCNKQLRTLKTIWKNKEVS
jgi:hypothetical protein